MSLTPDKQLDMLRTMQTIRRFEERASDDFQAGLIYGVVHCYIGQEAVATGICANLNRDDQIISTHRGHGHCIAKGADLKRMMAELYGKRTGYCKGKGGSMHIADFSIGMLGANGIVAGGIPIITGAGLAAQLEGKGRVAVSFFGDGASNAGPFHESVKYRGLMETAHAVRVREQPVRREYSGGGLGLGERCRRAGGRVWHPRSSSRWQRRVSRPRSRRSRRSARPCRPRSNPYRVQNLPLAQPYRNQRRPRSPAAGRARRVETQRPDCPPAGTASSPKGS